jgi:hypothetical protein
VKYVEKELKIPDENIGILSNPRDGVWVEGLTEQEAAEKAVRALCQAVIDQDMNALKNSTPVCQSFGEEFLQSVILRTGKDDRIVEVVRIGKIFHAGRTKLGPIVALPVVCRRHNGAKLEQPMIVQFHQIGGKPSCVVHGPYGLPHEIE